MLNKSIRIRLGMLLVAGMLLACNAARDKTTARYLYLSSGKIYYEMKGRGDEVIIFIHGGELDRRIWDDQFDYFAENYLVMRYDVHGYGLSPWLDGNFSSHEDLRMILDSLQIDTAMIVGLSLGGRIGIDFAIKYPDRVKSLVLLGPGMSGFPFGPLPKKWAEPLINACAVKDSIAAMEAWLQSDFMAPAMKIPRIAPKIRKFALENSGVFNRWLNADGYGLELDPPAYLRYKELKPSLLLIVGELDYHDIQAIVDSLSVLPEAKKVVVKDAGHIVNMEQPDIVNAELEKFFNAIK